MTNQILETKNKQYGFWGATQLNYSLKNTKDRWNKAFELLSNLSGKDAEDIRTFLDSRSGRHLADVCYKNSVEEIIMAEYFKWVEKDLFEDNKIIKSDKDNTLFGTLVLNELTGRKNILLYTYKNNNRVYKDYATCIDKNEKIYDIRMDFLTPIED